MEDIDIGQGGLYGSMKHVQRYEICVPGYAKLILRPTHVGRVGGVGGGGGFPRWDDSGKFSPSL